MDREVRHADEHVVADRLKDVSDAIGRLVKEHVELAKAEVQANARKVGRDAGVAAAGAFVAILGYVLLMFAVSFFIASAIGLGWGFLCIGGFHFLVGGIAAAVYAQRLRTKDKPGLPQTTTELRRDRVFLGQVGHIVRDEQRA